MKRIGNLFERVLERDNLGLAVGKAMRGKRDRPEVIAFLHQLESRLAEMAEQIQTGTFPQGRYRQFLIFDPKERIISAPCFAERVLHHAVINVCEPVFERWLIADTFACRKGKGRLAALVRARTMPGGFRSSSSSTSGNTSTAYPTSSWCTGWHGCSRTGGCWTCSGERWARFGVRWAGACR